jgi:hypothetical protein
MAKNEEKVSKNAGKEGTNKKQIGASAKELGFKYGVADLADELGIEPASVRVQLRNKGVEKNGAVYGWKNDKDFQAVVKQLRAKGSEKTEKTRTNDDEKPAKAAAKSASKGATKTAAKASKRPAREEEEGEGDDE